MFDPLATASRNEDGTLVVEISNADLGDMSEKTMRAAFERLNDQEAIEGEEEDDEMRVTILTEMESAGIDTDALNEMMAKELNIFNGEEYSFTKDLREGYDAGLSTSAADKIFDTLPDHVFWDIKRPLGKTPDTYWNQYNSARKIPNTNFFDMRNTERYFRMQKTHNNTIASVSYYRKY